MVVPAPSGLPAVPSLFASLVDDPSSRPDEFPTEADQDRERQRLFRLIEDLVKWENSNNKRILEQAYQEILKSTGGSPPPIADPFCGGGSIALEAQRLGLEAQASDLNPVAVLITKALIEIPPKFVGQPALNPDAKTRLMPVTIWEGASGLAEDVRYYGRWMRDRAFERIGHLYPKVKLAKEHGNNEATVIAWLWARTVKCPNPACGGNMPLINSFMLSTKPGTRAWVQPTVNHLTKTVTFEVKTGIGNPPDPPKVGRGAKFKCLICQQIAPDQHIKDEGWAGRMHQQLKAMVAEGRKGRVFVNPSSEHADIAASATPTWGPEQELANDPRNLWCIPYGLRRFRDLFTPRQLVALSTLTDLVVEAREQAKRDGGSDERTAAIATYLGLVVSRMTNTNSALGLWSQSRNQSVNVFSRQALPMSWDFPEVNPFAGAAGDIFETADSMADTIASLPASIPGVVGQLDATTAPLKRGVMYSTDPPYYDNIAYSDLSDFFYVWLRKALGEIYPDVFSTLVAPKRQELVATPYRFGGGKKEAEAFFQRGFREAFERMRTVQSGDYPLSVYYAFKQAEAGEEGNGMTTLASTGWETMLDGLLAAEFSIVGTWPVRSERPTGVKVAVNALASSIVLVCRPRAELAQVTTRKDFLASLKQELPRALRNMQKGNIAPVDLAQAAIGPGMAVFSRYRKVLESDGSAMRVRTALGVINQTLDEVLSEQESEFDPDTRWALAWFEQHAFEDGLYGEAEVLATAKALSITALAETRILHSRAGKVRLLRRDELADDWDLSKEGRLTVWSVTQRLIRQLDKHGEASTGALAQKVGGLAETARDLAYRLYVLSERKGWAEEAGYYNSLVVSWPAIAPKAFALS